jgi:hypothetical protein
LSAELQKKIKQYEELQSEITNLKARMDSSWWIRLFNSTKLKYFTTAHNSLYNSIAFMAHDHLLADDTIYSGLHKKNKALLAYQIFQLKVYSETSEEDSVTEKTLEGIIRENGYLYVYVKERYITESSLIRSGMSTRFSGSIDHEGYCLLNSVELHNFFPAKIPELLECKFSADGDMDLKVLTMSNDIGGNGCIEKMIGDPFSGDEINRRLYLSNRIKMSSIVDAFLDKIKAQ